MILRRLSIRGRLATAFALTCLLVLITGVAGLVMMGNINDNTEEIAGNWLPSVQVLAKIDSTINTERRVLMRHILEVDDAAKQKQNERLVEIRTKTLPDLLAQYEKLISSDEERALYQDFRAKLESYQRTEEQVLKFSNAGEAMLGEARSALHGESSTTFLAMTAVLDKDIGLNAKGVESATEASRQEFRQAKWIAGVVISCAMLSCVMLAMFISRSITQPLTQAVELANAVAEGDLSRQLQVSGQDELSTLGNALNSMSRNLSGLVSSIRAGTESIATASAQIAQGNADLSSRTEHQAASLQETAASMQQMDDTVRGNSDNARQANQLALQATQVATQGGQDVGHVVATMSAIQESSRRIADIIGVIDGIAFQTNILALNAAVEAARAGEQGRGFAVVASEVRSLAQRSANAAREIKGLITDSVEKVEMGTGQVNQAGQTIGDVVQQVRKVNDLIAEISASSTEQSQGVGQINQAVSSLDQTTQQNAALVEETSAAAESLRQQAQQLAQAVSAFKTTA